jgi:hypothetical protein
MAVRKVVYRLDDGSPLIGLAIERDGKLWLVPEWLQVPNEDFATPARIICLDGLRLEKAGAQYDADLVLLDPLNKDIHDGRRVSQKPLVIERPDIHLKDTDFHR